jgi:uncharacterized repeat protein (TIGR01451 family)
VGATAVLTAVLLVEDDYAAGELVNTVQVAADQADLNEGDNFAQVSTPVNTAADLSIVKVGLVSPAYAGDLLLYQIGVTNHGPSIARNVVITDVLPLGADFVSASPLCSESAGVVTCDLGNMSAGETISLLIQVRLDPTLPDGTSLTNTVLVSSDTLDPNGDNSEYSVSTEVRQPVGGLVDLELSKYASELVVAGETLTYTLVITNHGPAEALDVGVVDGLPTGLELVSASATQGLCNSGVSCLLGNLPAGGSTVVTIVAVASSSLPTGTVLLNQALVTSANPEIDSSNNLHIEFFFLIHGGLVKSAIRETYVLATIFHVATGGKLCNRLLEIGPNQDDTTSGGVEIFL